MNDHQLQRLLDAVAAHVQPGSKVSVLGLSYKPDTQVVEESQGIGFAARLSDFPIRSWSRNERCSKKEYHTVRKAVDALRRALYTAWY